MKDFRTQLKDKFIRYTQFDTMSDPKMVGIKRPTTEGQLVLLKALKEEAEKLGLEAYLGKESVVKILLKGNVPAPTIGFMAHVDTADDVMGNGVKAQLINYVGGDIILPHGIIKSDDNKDLERYIGSEIITSDGSTLLGSDDKAGVAIIFAALEHLITHPEIKHGDIEVYFTPDEETGAGMDSFPYELSSASAIYTVDGGDEKMVEAECFNAATVDLEIEGVSIHLGSARGILVNALKIASAIAMALPQSESPESTDERFGYYHVAEINGTHVKATESILIRDFDTDSFFNRIKVVEDIAKTMATAYKGQVKINTHISYRNMGAVNKKQPKAVDAIFEAGKNLGLEFSSCLIRGGTDGARFAEAKGVPAPNLFTGGHNLHSLTEWVSVEAMNNSVNLVLEIIKTWAN